MSNTPPQSKDQAFAALANLSPSNSADDVTNTVRDLLRFTHPTVGSRGQVMVGGNRPIDLLCGGAVMETKKPGALDEGKDRRQVEEYLNLLASQQRPDLGDDGSQQWKGVLTDGSDWYFYSYMSGKPLPPYRSHLTLPQDRGKLEAELLQTIDASRLAAPPTDSSAWFEGLLQPLSALASQVAGEPYFDVKQQLWKDLLAGAHIVPPGDPGAELDLFVRHTLLVATARLVAKTVTRSKSDVMGSFMVWLEEAGGAEMLILEKEIARYRWDVGRDLLKDIYHNAIPTDIRHDFGEYYTPDWLAQAVVEEVCDAKWTNSVLERSLEKKRMTAQILDPSCGSGTFIHAAIKHLESHIPNVNDPDGFLQDDSPAKVKLLNRLVSGIDLHPVAVELARTTKLLALGGSPGEPLNIWMGDSLQWAQKMNPAMATTGGVFYNVPVLEIHTSEPKDIHLPQSFVKSNKYEANLNALMQAAGDSDSSGDAGTAKSVEDDTDAQQIIGQAIDELRQLMQLGRNGVWGWYLSNIAQPFRLSQTKTERLVGNPPWVTAKDMAEDRRKDFETNAEKHGVWVGGKQAPHNDLAALFVAAATNLYLKDGCSFGFVLPHAALKTGHWSAFRSGDWNEKTKPKNLNADLSGAWNLKDIKPPPFEHSPSCVVFGSKASTASALADVSHFKGGGFDPSDSWETVGSLVKPVSSKKWPTKHGHYSEGKFRQGATLVPQPLVITEKTDPQPGDMVSFDTMKGKKAGKAKIDWSGSRHGEVEDRYAHEALFSEHVVPFGTTGCRYLIAPLVNEVFVDPNTQPDSEEMRGYWNRVAGEYKTLTAGESGYTDSLVGYLDHLGKLTKQFGLREPGQQAVVYIAAGTQLCAAVVPAEAKLILDSTLYYYYTTPDEAHYLCAIFNAPTLSRFFDEACHTTGRSHFHLRPVENLPIPEFDPANSGHQKLSDLSQEAHRKTSQMKTSGELDNKQRKNRQTVRETPDIQRILADIDDTIKQSKIIPQKYIT